MAGSEVRSPREDPINYSLDVAGFNIPVSIDRSEVETVHIPLLTQFLRDASLKKGRYVVFLAGPPGSGKSTLGALWEALAPTINPSVSLQVLPMDGFHYPNAVLDTKMATRDGQTMPLRQIKGSPETFDLEALKKCIDALRSGASVKWPRYDRQLHDPISDAITVNNTGVIIIEGNYLLLDEDGWKDLHGHADFSIYVDVSTVTIQNDVVARHMKGGRSKEDAESHFLKSDKPNVDRISTHRIKPDITLHVDENRYITTM